MPPTHRPAARTAPAWLHAACAFTVAVLLLVLSGPLAAQQAAAPVPAAMPATASTARPIAVPDILARAEDDQQQVDRVRRLLAAPDPLARLGPGLDAIARPVDDRLRAAGGEALRTLPLMRLQSLSRHWAFDAGRFAHWEAQARRALGPYADSALQLAQRRAAWSATRAEGLPDALAGRVDAMLRQIDATESALGEVLARQFALTQRASDLKARIEAGGNEVAAAVEDIDRRLLQVDAPPLWQGLRAGARAAPPMEALQSGLDIERQFAIDYNAAGSGNQQVLRVVQLLLLPLILWLVLRSRRAGAPGQEPVATVLRRPVSAWLLLSMLAVLLLEPDAPMLVQEIALVVALVPVLRLLPARTLRALGVWPYAAGALYGIDRLGVAAVADAGVFRLFLLVLNLLALALTAWMLRGGLSAAETGGGRLHRALRVLGWGVLVVLLVALGCNIVGNVSLAEVLTSGIIDSGYMALLLYASVTACLGLSRAVLGQPEIARNRLVQQHEAALLVAVRRLLVVAALLGWLLYTLDRFRILRPVWAAGGAVMGLGIDVGAVSVHLGDVLVFVLAAWLAAVAARAVRRVLRDELPGHAGLPRGVGNSIASLSYYGVLLLGLLVALSAAGFQVGQLALVFGALGVGIGFGLQNVVNNFVSGLVLMFERPIQPGDIVEAAGSSGTVREIGLRATTIRSFDGADVVVPNGLLLSGNLVNWTMFDRSRRVEITVGVAYGSDPAQVLALLQQVARETPGVAPQPAPVALMTDYGDSAINFVLRAWTEDIAQFGNLRGELLARILAALEAAGISIPYQQVDLHLHTVHEAAASPVPGDAPQDRAPAAGQ